MRTCSYKIADEVVAICEKEKDTANLKRLDKLLKESDKAIENLISALEAGENLAIINARITQKRKEKDGIEKEIILEKMQHFNLTTTDIKFFLTQLKKGDINDVKHRRTLINIFVAAIYLYDDKIAMIFNAGETPVLFALKTPQKPLFLPAFYVNINSMEIMSCYTIKYIDNVTKTDIIK